MVGWGRVWGYRKPAGQWSVHSFQGLRRTAGTLPWGGLRSRGGASWSFREMNNSQSSVRERKLAYIPIIHSVADMGTLGASIRRMKLSALGRQGLTRNAAVVEKMWEEIESVVANLPVTPGTVRLYQDGLPVCGHVQEIVSELSDRKSAAART